MSSHMQACQTMVQCNLDIIVQLLAIKIYCGSAAAADKYDNMYFICSGLRGLQSILTDLLVSGAASTLCKLQQLEAKLQFS